MSRYASISSRVGGQREEQLQKTAPTDRRRRNPVVGSLGILESARIGQEGAAEAALPFTTTHNAHRAEQSRADGGTPQTSRTSGNTNSRAWPGQLSGEREVQRKARGPQTRRPQVWPSGLALPSARQASEVGFRPALHWLCTAALLLCAALPIFGTAALRQATSS